MKTEFPRHDVWLTISTTVRKDARQPFGKMYTAEVDGLHKWIRRKWFFSYGQHWSEKRAVAMCAFELVWKLGPFAAFRWETMRCCNDVWFLFIRFDRRWLRRARR